MKEKLSSIGIDTAVCVLLALILLIPLFNAIVTYLIMLGSYILAFILFIVISFFSLLVGDDSSAIDVFELPVWVLQGNHGYYISLALIFIIWIGFVVHELFSLENTSTTKNYGNNANPQIKILDHVEKQRKTLEEIKSQIKKKGSRYAPKYDKGYVVVDKFSLDLYEIIEVQEDKIACKRLCVADSPIFTFRKDQLFLCYDKGSQRVSVYKTLYHYKDGSIQEL